MEKPALLFFKEDISYTLQHRKKIRKWLVDTIRQEKKELGRINFILCNDSYLHNLNITYLKHDSLTDIITFDYTENSNRLSGDVFISIDRVRENAKQFGIPVVQELYRVMVHGILHLAGWRDKTSKEKDTMRAKEDYYLSLLPVFLR